MNLETVADILKFLWPNWVIGTSFALAGWIIIAIFKLWSWNSKMWWVDSLSENVNKLTTSMSELKGFHQDMDRRMLLLSDKSNLMKETLMRIEWVVNPSTIAKSQSPMQFTPEWEDLIAEMWIKEILEGRRESIKTNFPQLLEKDNPLDIQELSQSNARDIFDATLSEDEKNKIKNIIFERWEWSSVIYLIIWIIVRDMVLEDKWIHISELKEEELKKENKATT